MPNADDTLMFKESELKELQVELARVKSQVAQCQRDIKRKTQLLKGTQSGDAEKMKEMERKQVALHETLQFLETIEDLTEEEMTIRMAYLSKYNNPSVQKDSDVGSQIEEQNSKLEIVTKQLTTVNKSLETRNCEYAQKEKDIKLKSIELAMIRKEHDDVINMRNQNDEELKGMMTKISEMEKELLEKNGQINNLKVELATFGDQVDNLNRDKDKEADEIKIIMDKLAITKEDMTAVTQTLEGRNSEYTLMVEEIKSKEKEVDSIRNKLDEVVKANKEREEDLTKKAIQKITMMEKMITDKDENISNLTAELTGSKDKQEEVMGDLKVKDATIATTATEIETVKEQLVASQKEVMSRARQFAECRLELSKAKSKVETCEKEMTKMAKEVTSNTEALKWGKEILARKEAKIQEVTKSLGTTQKEIRDKEESLIQNKQELWRTQTSLASTQKTLMETEEKLRKREREIAASVKKSASAEVDEDEMVSGQNEAADEVNEDVKTLSKREKMKKRRSNKERFLTVS